MQFAKDSFYMGLRDRLAALNPSRTVTIGGAERPAVVVVENELPNAAERMSDTFYIEWGATHIADGATINRPTIGLDCTITYFTSGTAESAVDRGRVLGQLGWELLSICQPYFTSKQDFSRAPSVNLGTNVFWTTPELEMTMSKSEAESQTARLQCRAKLSVFFFPEVNKI